MRKNKECGRVKILVGGYILNTDQHLWKRMGADGFAPRAEKAVQVAEQLVGHNMDED